MSQQNRKRQHQQSLALPVEDEQQHEEEEDIHSLGGGIAVSECSSTYNFEFENSNTIGIGTAAGGNVGKGCDEIIELTAFEKPDRKRHCLESPPVEEEQDQEQQEEDTHSLGGGIPVSECSSSNFEFEDSNTINTAPNGNGGDDMNELKMKMAALEAKNQILEGKLENQELRARLNSISEGNILANLKQENRAIWMRLKEVEENALKNARDENNKMKDEFAKMLASLEQKYKQKIAGLKANSEQNQQQQPIGQMPDHENLAEESHGNVNNSNKPFPQSCPKDREQPATIATAAAVLTPPPPRNSVAIYPLPCHSAQPQMANKKRLCNLEGNYWNVKSSRTTMKVLLPDQLTAHNTSPMDWGNLYAKKGFKISGFRSDQFAAGQMLYYYEITNKSASVSEESRFCIGLTNAIIPKDSWIGWTPNTYAMPEKCDYCLLSGNRHQFDGAIGPKWDGHGDIVGCGLVLRADHKLTIFFTNNGILMGKQMPIMPLGSNYLTPTVCLNKNVTLEANFGAKPFQYNIDKCPGMLFE